MKKNAILSIILLPMLLSACIYAETYRPESVVLVTLTNINIVCKSTYPKIYIGAGSHQLISDCTYRLVFDETGGGSTHFLGKKIREFDPWTDDRMVLTVDDIEYKFSIEDIKKMPTIVEGDSVVYQLNIH